MEKSNNSISINSTLLVPDYYYSVDKVLRDIVKNTKEKTRGKLFFFFFFRVAILSVDTECAVTSWTFQ